jgi:eukaryotic-like serine/threonine-protein kinase
MTWKRGFLYLIAPIVVFIISSYLTVGFLLKTGETVVCPDVRGKKVEDAKDLVANKGLSLAILRYETRNDVPYGYITVQKPEANITIRKGRVVNVLVSEGPRLIELPILIDEPLQEAEARLREKQITVGKTISVPCKKNGRILAQIPAGGTKVLEGGSVTLLVGDDSKAYYLAPDFKETDMSALSEEMDRKKIKYKISYGMSDLPPEEGETKTAKQAPPPLKSRMIFNAQDAIVIHVNGG